LIKFEQRNIDSKGETMKRIFLSISIFILLMVALIGCVPTPNSTTPITEPQATKPEVESTTIVENKDITIGFSCGWAWVPYTIATKLGAEVAAKEEGVTLISTSANNKMETQIADVENLAEKKVDGILMYAIDSAGLSPIAAEVLKDGIRLGTVDVGVSETTADFHVASDNYQIGVIAAHFVGDYLGAEGGEIAIVGWSTVDATVDREKGFQDTLSAEYPNVKIATYFGDGGSDRTAALDASENILQAHPGIKLIWGSNEQAALGALAAVDAANVNVPVFGVDSDVESLTAIINNPRFLGTVSQDPYMMGYMAVKTMASLLRGKTIQPSVVTETHLVTKENASDFLAKEQNYQDIYNSEYKK
jgi:ribose transport system substrate-binding protein